MPYRTSTSPARRLLLLLVAAAAGLSGCRGVPPASVIRTEPGGGAAGIDVPLPPQMDIGVVQGTGLLSAHVGRLVTVDGVVVGNFSAGLQGVFVQSLRADADSRSAEGIFVEHAANANPALNVGDRVQVSGRVAEVGDAPDSLTTLRESSIRVSGRAPIVVSTIAGAPADVSDWERFEGMAVRLGPVLTVSGNDDLAQQGELLASFGGRLYQPTELAMPGPAAVALGADNARRSLLLDDNRSGTDPDSLWFLRDPLSDRAPLRAGSQLRGVSGVVDQRRGRYRLQLTAPLDVLQAPRPPAPQISGGFRVASLNLLNLFNGDGRGGGFPTERGARTQEEYQRQQAKLVAAVQALAPDIAALMEVENDGSTEDSALAQFVAALNAAGPARDYRLVDSGPRLGSDAIRVALIYRNSRTAPVGAAAHLSGGPFQGRSRVPLAQAFSAGGERLLVVANHFKSKGCGRDENRAQELDADQGDGQSCWNATRVESARRLQAWLASDPTRTASRFQLIIGDLNAHAMEDPLRALHSSGWRDAFTGHREQPYSYSFDGHAARLDHALLNPALAARLRGAAEWHNNADESPVFDYHLDRDGDPYRASDHDPLLLGFDLPAQRL